MIKEVLDKQTRRSLKELNEAGAISEVKLLIDAENSNDIKMMQDAFPMSNNVQILKENANRTVIQRLQDKHHGNIYTKEEIKTLCMKYRLRFLPAKLYKGVVPIDFLTELRRKFTVENGLGHLTNAGRLDYSNNLFMIAPATMFSIEGFSTKRKNELAELKRLKRQDPAAFVKISDDKFLYLREWGNSFSPLRRIVGFLTGKQKTMNRLFFFAWMLYVVFSSYVANILWEKGFIALASGVVHVSWLGIVAIAFILWAGISSISWIFPADTGFFMAKFKDNNSGGWTVHKSLPTENNWN